MKFRQYRNYFRRVLEAVKLAYANTKKSLSLLKKGKSTIPPPLNGPEVLSSGCDKAKLFAENFSKNSVLSQFIINVAFCNNYHIL